MRQVVLDTETTGLEPEAGHRVIEIGCVELVNRRLTGKTFHRYLNPDREIDPGAVEVHGLTRAFLADKPRFGDVADEFLEFVRGSELVIHNAPFDVGFLDHELSSVDSEAPALQDVCPVLETLVLAREMHPGQRNSLDALCKRYEVDNSQRDLHGALLDARILADVYLSMTGGQADLSLGTETGSTAGGQKVHDLLDREGLELRVVRANDEEKAAHEEALDHIAEACGEDPLWRQLKI